MARFRFERKRVTDYLKRRAGEAMDRLRGSPEPARGREAPDAGMAHGR